MNNSPKMCIECAVVVGEFSPSALELLAQAAQALHIEACLGGLDGSHRQRLALAYYQGLSP